MSLNAGLLDAVNLGWKLAAQVQGRAPSGLLDSYHAERHLAGQHGIRYTRAQRALTAISEGGKDGPGEVSQEGAEALRELFGDVLQRPEPLRHIRELLRQPGQLRHIGELIEGSDVRYPIPAGNAQPHPLLGKLAPDLQLETPHGPIRVAELMHPAHGVLLDLTADSAVAEAPGPGRPGHRHHRTLPARMPRRHGTSIAGPESMTNSHERSRLWTGRACATTPAG